MKKKLSKGSKKNIPVYEHLGVSLRNTYAQRLKWLEEALDFSFKIKKSRVH